MSAPTGPLPVPAVVAGLAAHRPVSAVWVNELGGVTFGIGAPRPVEYVKTYPEPLAHLLAAEVDRLRWAIGHAPVPRVLAWGPGWLHTAALPGRSAVDPVFAERPDVAAAAIGTGLRMLHDALPVADCPFGPPPWVGDAPPPADRLVVCHGDACAPNTLIADDATPAGHVDLGELGVADRWADLAIATMSLDWNFGGEGFEAVLLDAYGVAPDPDRIAHYRARWNDEAPAPG
ncbi:aminoglycoside phosphotransferase [Mycolicibacterium chubuense NBB4]|uniref:Aminoglycoside phosphotransferase n=1 Tax=Mycolicibacterium chubuense (strain NBB4) TaxID=710421 RepID=I4BQY4_MYCCN|nr:aminoglycoside 3'-phosphotransferase [Mycolicibacterium chubuense]AFM19691.1 aminoglycoside phosphotransferase [Mycolicibacterium chubuense NBB4]